MVGRSKWLLFRQVTPLRSITLLIELEMTFLDFVGGLTNYLRTKTAQDMHRLHPLRVLIYHETALFIQSDPRNQQTPPLGEGATVHVPDCFGPWVLWVIVGPPYTVEEGHFKFYKVKRPALCKLIA